MRIAKSNKRFIPYIIRAVIVLIFLALIAIVFFSANQSSQLTPYELSSFRKEATPIMDYLEAIDSNQTSTENEQIDKYVAFAMFYSSNENGQNELTFDEITAIIERFFTIDTSKSPLETLGITPILLNYHINGGLQQGTYTIFPPTEPKTIARTPIIKYGLKEAKKSHNQIIATYTKYRIDDPYQILNYVSDHHIDAPGIGDYLHGDGKLSSVKHALEKCDLEQIASPEAELTIVFETLDAGLRVKEIR